MLRQLYLWHRWLGIILCLFMAAWFISGVVMLFVGYPKLTPAEHLERLPELNLSSENCCINVAEALERTGKTNMPSNIKLSSIAGKPYYLFSYRSGPVIAIDAATGEKLASADKNLALASADAFYQGDKPAEYLGLIERDAWTQSRGLDNERPLHAVRIHDEAERILYLSSHSGMVVRDATFTERSWGWLGAWLHWLYPVRHLSWWAELVIYLSLAGTFTSLIGQYLGLKRWRFSKVYKNGSHSPYVSRFTYWHHIIGLVFGIFLIAWVFSGLMSMRPWNLLSTPTSLETTNYHGDITASFTNPPATKDLLKAFQNKGMSVSELEWVIVDNQAWVTAYVGSGHSQTLAMTQPNQIFDTLPVNVLEKAVGNISTTHQANSSWLTNYDFYYVAREQQSMYGGQHRPLPIMRVKFDDTENTWYHINPFNGDILQVVTESQRANRWLFNLLHSWDWHVLLSRPWLREGLIILFSLGGFIISITGVVLGYRRLVRKLAHRQKSHNGLHPNSRPSHS